LPPPLVERNLDFKLPHIIGFNGLFQNGRRLSDFSWKTLKWEKRRFEKGLTGGELCHKLVDSLEGGRRKAAYEMV
jgi:hypothetical protein